MATSSIFANFNLTDPAKARAFAEALEWSATHPAPQPKCNGRQLTDPKELDEFFRKLNQKYGCPSGLASKSFT